MRLSITLHRSGGFALWHHDIAGTSTRAGRIPSNTRSDRTDRRRLPACARGTRRSVGRTPPRAGACATPSRGFVTATRSRRRGLACVLRRLRWYTTLRPIRGPVNRMSRGGKNLGEFVMPASTKADWLSSHGTGCSSAPPTARCLPAKIAGPKSAGITYRGLSASPSSSAS